MGIIQREWQEAKDAGNELGRYSKSYNYKKGAKSLFSFNNWGLKLAIIILVVGTTLLSIYHKQIVTAFEPHKQSITNFPISWIFPIILLIIVSFPPLFGHEVIILVVGLIWGLGIGTAIACAGTFLGEVACFLAFKYYFVERAQKIEDESLLYAALAKLMREGGLRILVLVRFSLLPGHVVSAIQATIGTNFWIYTIAVFLSLPKQFAIVYLGVIFGESASNSTPSTIAKERAISLSVFAVTFLISLVAFFFIWTRARRYYQVIEEERRLKGLELGGGNSGSNGYSNDEGIRNDNNKYGGVVGNDSRQGWTGFEGGDNSGNNSASNNSAENVYNSQPQYSQPQYSQHSQQSNNVPIYNARVGGGGNNSKLDQQYSEPEYQEEDDRGPRGYLGAGGSGNSQDRTRNDYNNQGIVDGGITYHRQ